MSTDLTVGRIVQLDSGCDRYNHDLTSMGMEPVTAEEFSAKSARRRTGEDRRKGMQQLVLAARICEQRMIERGDDEGASILRAGIEGCAE